ncbi:putative oxidoreductase [Rhodococcus fascians]|uniref:DoxX family protein n=1 Tax=Nocardiaceae TaxID=85025 RepID=UPI00050CB727|nr:MULTISPECIES: DoxX family protein [Rhodococcus]MDR6912203.1 putative oxidoreductase [Rhodococcus sp. 3258]MDR6933974.1 putative oxidoreductase [Rhodococcus fascians]OZD82977.1 DoxX family membrane protein [Rhodococcus sp. 05-2256-B4]OZD96236.1 DoxX family membrane protein [Rhodococcus sp. 05-2256-B2]OZD96659.1 DoxX family membrane protein [Rhodococcus sp. 05-2256-B3]
MTDTPRDPNQQDPSYEPAESPYDNPTEKISPTRSGSDASGASTTAFGAQRSDRLPRTDDELDFPHSSASDKRSTDAAPTEKIPTYRPSAFADSPTQTPTTATTAGATSNAYSDRPTEYLGESSDSAVAAPAAPVRTETVEVPARRGTTDLGLFVLRVAIGAVFLGHGLQKLVGLWNGPGLDGFQNLLEESGFRYPEILAIAAAAGETLGGALLILGLATPLAGAAVLATIINAWCFKQVAEPGLQFSGATGVEYETVLGFAAAAIILTGPGKIAFDGRRGWATRPRIGSFLALAVGIAAGVCIWIFLNGANPVVR